MSHRAALLAALAVGPSRIDNFLHAGVTGAMLGALRSLGAAWELRDDRLTLDGKGPQGLRPPDSALDCGHSATTLRLLAGALAGANVPVVLDGSPRLRMRPMTRIMEPLQAMGVPIHSVEGGRAPLVISPRPPGECLQARSFTLPVASAQVKTALLLAGLGAEGVTEIVGPGPSRDHTERLLADMGVEIEAETERDLVRLTPPDQPLSPLDLTLPGDFSSAAFLICAALISPGSEIMLRDVGLNPTRTGLLDALIRMGARVEITHDPQPGIEPRGDIRVSSSTLRGIAINGPQVVRMIDEFPVFAIAAALAEGETVVHGAEELRHKESDRISALCNELQSIGGEVEELPDGFRIQGRPRLKGGVVVKSHNDHRLAMAFCVAGLAADEEVAVDGAGIISQSYPGFLHQIAQFGARIDR
jgi:3-phosphoshikimate 1-carboxyvinyltransferase